MRLIEPDEAFRRSFVDALREFQPEGRHLDLDSERVDADFGGFVAAVRGRIDPANVAPDRVPETVLWLVNEGEFVGQVSIRHRLNDHLREVGGHIGYAIRPSRRRMGYGARILALALPRAAALGLERVLVTCDEDNLGSRRIIERNGGLLENAVAVPGSPVRKLRYWIDLG